MKAIIDYYDNMVDLSKKGVPLNWQSVAEAMAEAVRKEINASPNVAVQQNAQEVSDE